MTQLTQELKTIYEKYGEAGSQPRKRSFGELFKGWFSGHGKETLPIDSEFMDTVAKKTAEIRETGDAEDAAAAAELILSQPRSKKFSEQDVVYAAMYANIIPLVPMLTDDDVKRINDCAEQVPKQYRFPVYKDLRQKLDDRIRNHMPV